MKQWNRSRIVKLGIVVLCVLLLIAAVIAAVLMNQSSSCDPPTETTKAADETKGTDKTDIPKQESSATLREQPDETKGEQIVQPPEDLPAKVEIPVETDPQTGETVGIQFPSKVPGYELVLEKLAPYNGVYVEDGSNAMATDVAMLLVRNDGDFPVEYTQIEVRYETETLLFDVTALPVGQRLVVQEKTGKSIPDGDITACTALIVQRAEMEMSQSQVRVTDNGNNTLRIENLTDKTIQTVRVFYKYYMADEDVYVGGIAFTVRVRRLAPHATMTIQPSHFDSTTSRVVMVLTYDNEV